jgi:hypothetical protein
MQPAQSNSLQVVHCAVSVLAAEAKVIGARLEI